VEFALYYAPTSTADPEVSLKQLIQKKYSTLNVTVDGQPIVSSKWVKTVDYQLPDLSRLKYFGREVQDDDLKKMIASERAFVMDFDLPRNRVVKGNFDAAALVADLAAATGGFPWDDECRLLYSAKRWRMDRVDTWSDGLPNIAKHLTIHVYRKGALFRLVTLGMGKFALPDIVINDASSSDSRCLGHLINACAQHFVEGSPRTLNAFTVDFAAIRHPAARESLLSNPKKGATGQAVIAFVRGVSDEGDPINELLEIDFPSGNDKAGVNERQHLVVDKLFGSDDSIINVKNGNAELAAASKKARDFAVATLKPRVAADKLGPNERVTIKFPFATPKGGKEFMWVEVVSWKDAIITGILQNDPFNIPDLKAGAKVSNNETDIYDFIWRKQDGSEMGNETGKIIERLQKASSKQ